MKHKIEFDEVCKSCNGTGLYVGMAERDGAAVVCHTCKGTGCHHFVYEYEDFEGRTKREDVERVYQVNPGIIIGCNENKGLELSDFGGIPYSDWLEGQPFGIGSENRQFTCPAWWYQSVDYKKTPEWCYNDYGFAWGAFSSCPQFTNKGQCWERFDKEIS